MKSCLYGFVLFLSLTGANTFAQNGKVTVQMPACFKQGPIGEMENTSLITGDFCIDTQGQVRIRKSKKNCWNFSQTSYDVNGCFKLATKKQLKEYYQRITANEAAVQRSISSGETSGADQDKDTSDVGGAIKGK